MRSNLRNLLIFTSLLAISACGSKEPPPTEVGFKLGKPYEVNGTTYVPEIDNSYDKVGEASWYGPGFHGKRTASGEKFDEHDITAAHPTLPMPSLVRVTNMRNDKSVVVRINDRGPFHSNRIIDLSRGAAEAIDMKSTQPVRVKLLARETDAYIAAFKATGKKPIDMAEYNQILASGGEDPLLASYSGGVAKPQMIAANDNVATDAMVVDDVSVNAAPEPSITSTDIAAPSGVKQAASVPARSSQTNGKHYAFNDSGVKGNMPFATSPSKSLDDNDKKKASGSVADSGQYIVLAGAFSSEENAKKLIGKLPAKNKAVIDKIQSKGKDWWRVHLGPFNDKEKAESALESVIDAGVKDARIGKL